MAEKFPIRWKTLDKDLDRIGTLELGTKHVSRRIGSLGAALAFLALVGVVAAAHGGAATDGLMLVAAALFAGYLALAIGANDVANNMGPVVGARALSLGGALLLAAVAESAGALLAGWDVVDTIANGILKPDTFHEDRILVLAMLAALMASAIWLNLATWAGLAVSTTHSVVGGVMGAGIAAAGLGTVNWVLMGQITASWMVAPVAGGLIAAGLLAFLKARILYAEDRIAAVRLWLPILIAVMSGVFTAYLAVKGLERVVKISPQSALLSGFLVGALVWTIARPLVWRRSEGLDNRRRALKRVFALPLILAGVVLSFGHGANDVSNAVGPLVAIAGVLTQEGAGLSAPVIPLWVMCVGAAGISFGLLLFGPRLIRLVGSEITKLNPMRGFCVVLATAATVILASWLGLPVSSTHIAVGAIFGVGFYREWYLERRSRRAGKGLQIPPSQELRQRRRLVRRSHVVTLTLAWMVTVPLTALASGLVYLALATLLP